MTGPWFRRCAGFGYKPTTMQGRAVILVMAAVFIACGAVWMGIVETRPKLAWVIGCMGVLAAVAGHAIVLWKMDWNYPSR